MSNYFSFRIVEIQECNKISCHCIYTFNKLTYQQNWGKEKNGPLQNARIPYLLFVFITAAKYSKCQLAFLSEMRGGLKLKLMLTIRHEDRN